ncbi:hypothetical protein HKX48_002281 [Thoreauomyces humboldtii]|nr:hypothetical protein HKX48_002281 [Thoreauomyces humboldtii]
MSLSAAHIVARGPLSLPDAPPRSRYPRTNVLQLPQIHRELASLSANLSRTRSVIDAHDARLLEARRRAVAEMVETRREEGMCMEGVELELAEGEQGVLLSGALEVLERHEGKGGLHHHHDHERKVVDDVDGNEAPDVGTTTTTTIVTRRRRRTENKVQTDPILMHTGDVYKTAPHMPHRFKRPGESLL